MHPHLSISREKTKINPREEIPKDEEAGTMGLTGRRLAAMVGGIPDARGKRIKIMDGEELRDAVMGRMAENPPDPACPARVSDPRYQGLASEKGYSQESGRIEKTKYSHEAMVDLIIARPNIKQGELATEFGFTQAWVSRVMGSDAFQAYLAKRRDELTDPFLVASIEERLRGLTMQSLDILGEKLEATRSADLALKALDIGVKSLGFGARDRNGPTINNNFVVAMPAKAESETAWAAKHTTIDLPPSKPLSNFSTTIDRDPTVQPVSTQLAD